jgi:hypothetical protein
LGGLGLVFGVDDELEEVFLDGIRDFDEFGALTHDIGLLDPAPGRDVVFDGRPLLLLDGEVLAALVEDAGYELLLLELLDLLHYFLGGKLELVTQVLQQAQLVGLQDADQLLRKGLSLPALLLLRLLLLPLFLHLEQVLPLVELLLLALALILPQLLDHFLLLPAPLLLQTIALLGFLLVLLSLLLLVLQVLLLRLLPLLLLLRLLLLAQLLPQVHLVLALRVALAGPARFRVSIRLHCSLLLYLSPLFFFLPFSLLFPLPGSPGRLLLDVPGEAFLGELELVDGDEQSDHCGHEE